MEDLGDCAPAYISLFTAHTWLRSLQTLDITLESIYSHTTHSYMFNAHFFYEAKTNLLSFVYIFKGYFIKKKKKCYHKLLFTRFTESADINIVLSFAHDNEGKLVLCM